MPTDNARRAEHARATVRAYGAMFNTVKKPPASRNGVAAMLFDHAYAAMTVYAITTGNGPEPLHPGPPPGELEPYAAHATWTETQQTVARIMSDFLADVRHMLDQNRLDFDALAMGERPGEDHPAAIEAMVTANLFTSLRVYAHTCRLDFDTLANQAEDHYAAEVAAEIRAAADTVKAATPAEISRAAAALHIPL